MKPESNSPAAAGSVISHIAHNGDTVRLGPNGYQAYATHIADVCRALSLWCESSRENYRCARAIEPLVARLGNTLALLLYRYRHTRLQDITLDLRDGGFPKFTAMMEIVADLQGAPDLLREGDSRALLRESIIHELSQGNDPVDIVWALARREYIRRLVDSPQFLPFNVGELSSGSCCPGGRFSGEVTWAFYCPASSLPIFCHMQFEWSGKTWIGDDPTQRDLMLEVLRGESFGTRDVCHLARQVDQALPKLHPKELRRLRVGPVRSAIFSCEEHPMVEELKAHGHEGDFALEMRLDGALSSGEYDSKASVILSVLGGAQKLQRFAVPGSAPGAPDASFVRQMVILPHALAQHLHPGSPAIQGYEIPNIITYDGEQLFAVRQSPQ